jgi:hypothetical protein
MTQPEIEMLRLYINDPTPNEQFDDPKLQEFINDFTFDGEVNLNAAAAKLWAVKAGSVSAWYTTSLDGSFLSRDQVFQHCLRMAEYYGLQGGGDPASWRSVLMDSSSDDGEETPWEF